MKDKSRFTGRSILRVTCMVVLIFTSQFALAQGALPQTLGMDAQCEQSVKAAHGVCAQDAFAAMKSCFAKRLSPPCAAQANAPPSTPRSDACQDEFKTVVGPCGAEFVTGNERCIASKLDAKCNAQYTAATKKMADMQLQCKAEMGPRLAKMQDCIKLPAANQEKCLAALKAEKSSCNF